MNGEPTNRLVDEPTPGPWWTDAKYDGSEFGCSVIAARTDCGPLPGNPTRGQVAFATAILHTDARKCEANARLIAAAPDLLAACKASLALGRKIYHNANAHEAPMDWAHVRKLLETAIDKSEGRS